MQSNPETLPLPDPAVPPAADLSASSSPDEIVHLNFAWRGLNFHARLDRGSVSESHLVIESDLGPVPFTAEGVQRRTNVFALLDATKMGINVRTVVSSKQRINMFAEMKLPAPVTTTVFITGIVTLLALARPYLEIMDLLQHTTASVRGRH